jgi:hypothetical protein
VKKYYLIILFLFASIFSYSQEITLSEEAEVSILTIGPGANLYDKFGHSAFRVQDKVTNIDIVYNFGVYDFNTPNFYLKFARGKLLYKLDTSPFSPFYNYYVRQNRWIEEQVLNFTPSEKQTMFDFLQNNAKPEHCEYMYDFLFDNCATRIRDVLVKILPYKLEYIDDYITEQYTFRQLIQKNVDWNTWGSFGMDVAIGSVVDRKATSWQYQFLPQYVFEGAALANKTEGNKKDKLIKQTNSLFANSEVKTKSNFFLSPLFIFGLISFLILFITYKDYKNNRRSRYMDAIIFFVTGLVGVFLLLLWVATDHSTTANNYDLLWAFPLSLFLTSAIAKKNPKKWIRKYIFLQVLMLLLLCLHWFTGVQIFAFGLIPLLIALGLRYVYLIRFLKLN